MVSLPSSPGIWLVYAIDGDLMLACLGTIYTGSVWCQKERLNDNRKLKTSFKVGMLNEANPFKALGEHNSYVKIPCAL